MIDTQKLQEKPQLLPPMDMKWFPAKKYSFGVSRKDAKKVHVQNVYWTSEEGLANPGPGQYYPPAPMGRDSPKYSLSAKDHLLECKHYTNNLRIVAHNNSNRLPAPNTYQISDVVGPIKPTQITSRITTPQINTIPKAQNRFKLPSKIIDS